MRLGAPNQTRVVPVGEEPQAEFSSSDLLAALRTCRNSLLHLPQVRRVTKYEAYYILIGTGGCRCLRSTRS